MKYSTALFMPIFIFMLKGFMKCLKSIINFVGSAATGVYQVKIKSCILLILFFLMYEFNFRDKMLIFHSP